jgi:phosphoglycolate phosphatase
MPRRLSPAAKVREPSMSSRPTIAFDLDGTLVDSAPDLLKTLNLVLGESGLGPIAAGDARGMFGSGARALIERGLAHHGIQPEASRLERMQSRFLDYYADHLADHTLPYPGATEVLQHFAARNARLIVVTNKFERFSVKLLAALGLHEYFHVVAGPDTFNVRKPDPDHLLRAVEKAGGHAASTVMIGDSPVDVATARAADVPVIAVSYGYRSIGAEELGADKLIDRLEEVPAAVEQLLAARARA